MSGTTLTPRAVCERYTDEIYAKMRDDHVRSEAYERAITQHAAGRVCLDIGTGALALLAVMAARAGALHVYAVEANADAAQSARETVEQLGLVDVVTIVDGYSTDVQLPQPVDLLLHEIIGEVAGYEGVVTAVNDARQRHLRADAPAPLSIPARVHSLCAPSEFPTPEYFASLQHPMLSAPGASVLKLPGIPRR